MGSGVQGYTGPAVYHSALQAIPPAQEARSHHQSNFSYDRKRFIVSYLCAVAQLTDHTSSPFDFEPRQLFYFYEIYAYH